MSPMDAVGMVFTAMWIAALLYGWVRWGLTGTIERLVEGMRWFVERVAHGPQRKPEPQTKAEFGSIHTYYGGHEITKAVEDLWSPIENVIRAVEQQCDKEVRVSESYRKDPTLIYAGHPWMEYVRSGNATWLGWSQDHKPGPSPVERRRNYKPLSQQGGWTAPSEVVDLDRYIPTQEEMIPQILRYDVEGRPIYAKAVPANTPKPEYVIGLPKVDRITAKHVDPDVIAKHLMSGVLSVGDAASVVPIVMASGKVRHVPQEVKVNDPDTGEYLGSVGVCPCGDCESEPWDDRARNGG